MTRRDIYIGDIQGCWDCFARLLDKLNFDPAADRLCLAGDLVNRGGKSLKVLRNLTRLGEPHFSVLGNHDLHLLAYWHMHPKVRKPNPEFERILDHESGPRVIEWLRQQPLLWLNKRDRIALVHAGIDPRWTRKQAIVCANEVSNALTSKRFGRFIENMYGNTPDHWHPDQKRDIRLRTITNVLTRMRFVRSNGRVDFSSAGDLKHPPRKFRPWFELLHADWNEWSVVFGHWSLLGLHKHDGGRALCLDSGCVWGEQLSALVVTADRRRIMQIECP